MGRMTSFYLNDKNDADIKLVVKKEERTMNWIINKALSIYLQNKLGVNARIRGNK